MTEGVIIVSLQPTMPSVWARHRWYTTCLFASLLTTFYLLFIASANHGPFNNIHAMPNNNLTSRLQRSHRLYDSHLAQREGLIKKFGPDAQNISLCVFYEGPIFFRLLWQMCIFSFPPQKPPYPPYTVCKLLWFHISMAGSLTQT